ncbi:MAG: glycosyl hydrolase [Kiritimatiellia bacterium]|jgi:hypothetical protein|nr:glycosyl hydrolase [Kiritimatiellia bacterium]
MSLAQRDPSFRDRFLSGDQPDGGVVLWWLNGTLTREKIYEQLSYFKHVDGFGGIAPLTLFRFRGKTEPEYLSEGYFEFYQYILDTARELELTVVFYDDCDFPTGSAGGKIREECPQHLMKYLCRRTARNTTEQKGLSDSISIAFDGKLMSAVARRVSDNSYHVVTDALECQPIATAEDQVESYRAIWRCGEGVLPAEENRRWELQVFSAPITNKTGLWLIDFLSPEAVEAMLSATYEQFYRRFGEHFGTTIKMSFFDDLAVADAPDNALWTDGFNEKFEARYGYDPSTLYPALFEDIGESTRAARAQLLDFRNDLFSRGFPKVVEEWAHTHGIKCSGHPGGSYRAAPLEAAGDAIKFYKHQGYPLTDCICSLDNGMDGFKIPAAATHTYDKSLLVCETFGAFLNRECDQTTPYRTAMQLYTRGVNYMLPHGAWYDMDNINIYPEVTSRHPVFGDEVKPFNTWVSRCEPLLRAGRHVADIAVYYPIDDLCSRFTFAPGADGRGRLLPHGTDYYEVNRILFAELRRDFTFVHPEVLIDNTTVSDGWLHLNNRVNHEHWKVLILPTCETIQVEALRKIKAFHDDGGIVIATGALPAYSFELDCDVEVRQLAESIFDPALGGCGRFVPYATEESLAAELDSLDHVWDVRWSDTTELPKRDAQWELKGVHGDWYRGGNRQFTYIHRHVDRAAGQAGMEVYYFANSSDESVRSEITLRGEHRLEAWDPKTVQSQPLPVETSDGQTRFTLTLPPVSSLFVVSQPDEE